MKQLREEQEVAKAKPDKTVESPEDRRSSAVKKADEAQGIALGEFLVNTTNEQQLMGTMNYDFGRIGHMTLSSAATLVVKFSELFTPLYDILLQAVVMLVEKVKSTDVVVGGMLRSDMHQEIFTEYIHIHMGYFAFNKCSKLSRMSDKLQEVNRSSDDPVKVVQAKL